MSEITDADAHLFELRDMWERFLGPGWRDSAAARYGFD